MTHAFDIPAAIGPTTESRLSALFADAALATAEATARFLGMDTDTLSDLADQGVIRAIRRGKRRAYTEGDLRAYLIHSAAAEKASRKPVQTVAARGKVVPFSQRKDRFGRR